MPGSVCQHHPEITQLFTSLALKTLSTTTHNIFTFTASEISSNNSEKLSLAGSKFTRNFALRTMVLLIGDNSIMVK